MKGTTDLLIENCRVVSPGMDISRGWVAVAGGRISAVGEGVAGDGEAEERFDGRGRTLVPGFVDIHTHGAGGRDFCDGEPETLREIARFKVREGVTTFLPTTLTLPEEQLRRAIAAGAAYMGEPDFARAPCLHIEGPFINPDCAGAQNPAYVRPPDFDELRRYREIAPVGIVSLAVELEGALPFIERLAEMGIAASAAHSAATYADYVRARRAGLRHLTHFCNQMTGLHHREIGLVGAGLMDEEVAIELICDGVHLCPEMLRLVFQLKPVRQLMMITDSVAHSWLADGEFELAGLRVIVREGIARLESGALAGSTLRYHRGLKLLAETTGLPLSELIGVTSLHQARALGWEDRGEIRAGALADLVLLDEEFEPAAVWVNGCEKLAEAGAASS